MSENHIKVTIEEQECGPIVRVIDFNDSSQLSINNARYNLSALHRGTRMLYPNAKISLSIFRPCDAFDIDVVGDFGV